MKSSFAIHDMKTLRTRIRNKRGVSALEAFVALTLLRLINRTDESVVRKHWPGGGDIVSLADSIANIAPKFLPKRVARVLTSKVELAPAGKVLRNITTRDEALVREIVTDEIPNIDARSRMAN